MYKNAAIVGLATLSVALMYQNSIKLVINGEASKLSAMQIKGETYIPMRALQGAGAQCAIRNGTVSVNFPAKGGANQTVAVEGPQDQWLFNGVWRFKTTAPADSGDSFSVKVELKNGSKADDLSLSGTGFDSLRLVLDDGQLLESKEAPGDMVNVGFAQGTGQSFTFTFAKPEGSTAAPQKLILLIKPDAELKKYMAGRLGISYSVQDPSFRVIFSK